jgi:hypothetical protein
MAIRLQEEEDEREQRVLRSRGTDRNAKVFVDDGINAAGVDLDEATLEAAALADELDEEELADMKPTEFDILVGQSFNRARATGAAGAFRLLGVVWERTVFTLFSSKHDIQVSMARNARSLTENLPNCGDLTVLNVGITNTIMNRLNERTRINERRRIRHKQTEDTAVVDRVLDQSTRLKLVSVKCVCVCVCCLLIHTDANVHSSIYSIVVCWHRLVV